MESAIYHNPYTDKLFFGFLVQLLLRAWGFLSGNLSRGDLVDDELQILVLACVAASSALIGTFLVLRKMTMLANSLSHTILLGIVLTYLIPWGLGSISHERTIDISSMLIASSIMGIATTFLTEFLTKTVKLQEDASTGLAFTTLFALGIVLLTYFTKNSHIGTEVVMGNADSLHFEDLWLAACIFVGNALLIVLLYKEYQITTFDGSFASSMGIPTAFFNYLLMTQASFTIVGAFRAVGVLMVLAFLTGPALTARLFTHHLKSLLVWSMLIGIAAAVAGVALSRHLFTQYGYALSTSGVTVCVIALFFVLGVFLSPQHGILKRLRQQGRVKEA